MISVVERVQYDHTLGRAWSSDGFAVYASVRKTDAVSPLGNAPPDALPALRRTPRVGVI